MPEKMEFSELEQILMNWSDEGAMRLAFAELSSNFLHQENGDCRYPGFEPKSIADYRDAAPVVRQEALDYCLEVARSERFSDERDEELKSLCNFLKKLTPADFRDSLLNCVRDERSKHAGYLGLVQYLLQLEKVAA